MSPRCASNRSCIEIAIGRSPGDVAHAGSMSCLLPQYCWRLEPTSREMLATTRQMLILAVAPVSAGWPEAHFTLTSRARRLPILMDAGRLALIQLYRDSVSHNHRRLGSCLPVQIPRELFVRIGSNLDALAQFGTAKIKGPSRGPRRGDQAGPAAHRAGLSSSAVHAAAADSPWKLSQDSANSRRN